MNQLEKAEQKLFTANAVVNGILNMKYVEIEAKQIEAKLDVKLPEILGITGTDLGVLFGNILDNAIEACESCKKEKWIDLFAVYENHGIVICCKNSCSETVMDLHTRKSDKRNHGFGLSSVKQIVEKYNGDVWWESEKESFTLNINLWEKLKNSIYEKYSSILRGYLLYFCIGDDTSLEVSKTLTVVYNSEMCLLRFQ